MSLDSFHLEEHFNNFGVLDNSNCEIKIENYFELKSSQNSREQEMKGNKTYEVEVEE